MKPCVICKKLYSPRKDKLETSRTCSLKCRGKYAGQRSAQRYSDSISSETKEQVLAALTAAYEKYVVRQPGCWGWNAAVKPKMPYGQLAFRRKNLMAHRVSYKLFVGEIPDGMMVLHKCDNPTCSNPEHLFLGTKFDNKRDQIKKGRSSVEKLSVEQVREIKELLKRGVTSKRIASDYEVSLTTMWSIKTGRTWADIV